MKGIVQDLFTARLLELFKDLTKRGAYEAKKDFCEAIKTRPSNFNMIEKRLRKYPENEEKRGQARSKLYENYGANPDYLLGKSDIMYLKEPKPVNRVAPLQKVELNFRDIKEKKKVLDELQSYKAKANDLEQQVNLLQEELAKYKTAQKK